MYYIDYDYLMLSIFGGSSNSHGYVAENKMIRKYAEKSVTAQSSIKETLARYPS